MAAKSSTPELPAAAGLPAWRRAGVRKWVGRALLFVFFAAVAYLVVRQARTIDWEEVFATLRAYRASTLLGAGALVAASYFVYGCFDVLSRRYVKHDLANWRTIAIGAVSYAFNLNLGPILGGAGFRLRLYSAAGLEQSTIAAMILFSMLTNWLGYCAVAGIVFAHGGIEFPEGWKAGDGAMRVIGAVMVAVPFAYLAVCHFSARRSWKVRGIDFVLPSSGKAFRQVVLGATNWLVIAAVIYLLLGRQVAYTEAIAVLCVASVTGAMTHIPGGLGVLEAVFVAMLGWKLGVGPVLGAVLAYRALYYLVPLVVAGVVFVLLEAYARRHPSGPESRGSR